MRPTENSPQPSPTQPENLPTQPPAQAAPSSAPSPAPSEVSLAGGDAEVWAWEKRVHGKAANCPTVQVAVNGQTLEAPVEEAAFAVNAPLNEGENQVSASCGSAAASGPLTYTVRLRDVPTARIEIRVEGGQVIVDGTASQPAPNSASPITEYSWSARETNPSMLTVVEPGESAGQSLQKGLQAQQLVLSAPEEDGEYYLTLRVVDQAGREDSSTVYFTVTNGEAQLDDWETENTAWVEKAIVYGVIPRKFGSSNQAFKGITERLDSLQDLGVNAMWLAPINVSPPGDYGYAVMDYFHLRPQLGTEEDFRQMVQEAHKRGIRVLMDFVPNHSSIRHRYFEDTLKHGMDSHYWDFYDRDDTGVPTHYFDWTNLPNLNFNNPEVARWMTEAFAYWVREFDVDGFRVDVAWGIRERNPEYWPEWRRELKRIKPDLLLLAEASARDEYYFTNGFDAAYDWTAQLGRWAWQQAWEDEGLRLYNLDAALTNGNRGFHPDALIFRFINNNDTGPRFISNHGEGLTRVATALVLTLPGIPCVYTGDEIGAQFTPYGDPNPLDWSKEVPGLRDYHKQLISLRKEVSALHSRDWKIITVEPHTQIYGYLRYDEGQEGQAALVLLNFAEEDLQADVTLPEGFENFFAAGTLRDALSGETFPAAAQIPMPALTARVLINM